MCFVVCELEKITNKFHYCSCDYDLEEAPRVQNQKTNKQKKNPPKKREKNIYIYMYGLPDELPASAGAHSIDKSKKCDFQLRVLCYVPWTQQLRLLALSIYPPRYRVSSQDLHRISFCWHQQQPKKPATHPILP